MDRTRAVALFVAIAAATGLVGISHAHAEDGKQPPAQATTAPDAQRPEPGMRGPGGPRPRLFTPEERAQFEQKMKSAKTPEERRAVHQEMRSAFEQRARERGVAMGPRPDQPGQSKLGPQDHQRFQERWNDARTNKERDALRKEMMATIDQRSQPGGSLRPDMRRGPAAQLVSPEERAQFRDKMKNAKDRDERRKLMAEMHATVEARAKEKGIQLPDRGRMEHRPMHGPRPDDGAPRPQG
jgi:hypothetical protein